jgi:hypothetical protein
MQREVTIPIWRVQELQASIKRLARAATRIGVPVPRLNIDLASKHERKQTVTTAIVDGGSLEAEETEQRVVECVTCTIDLPDMEKFAAPGEWQVLGVLQRVQDLDGKGTLQNEIFAAPENLKALEGFRACPLGCDHCKVNRVRTKTLVLRAKDGRMGQYGVECAQNYVGDRLEAEIGGVEFQELIGRVIDPFAEGGEYSWNGAGGRTLKAWDAEDVAAHSNAAVRTLGWVPSQSTDENNPGPNANATWRVVRSELEHNSAVTGEIARLESRLAGLREPDVQPVDTQPKRGDTLIEGIPANVVETARGMAIELHAGQTYGAGPFTQHLGATETALREVGLYTPKRAAGVWLHESKEDAGATSELLAARGIPASVVAIVSAVTDEPGVNRAERKAKTYPKIAGFPDAVAVKLADRIANVTATGPGSHLEMYEKEYPAFRAALYTPDREFEWAWAKLDASLHPSPWRRSVARDVDRTHQDLARCTVARPYEVTDDDREAARKSIEWISGLQPDPEKDRYLADLQAVYSPGWVSEKRLAIAASLGRSHQRSLDREEMQKQSAKSVFVGTPGDRTTLALKFLGHTPFEGAFGTGYCCRFVDPNGNAFRWFTGANCPFYDQDKGGFVSAKATVKSHEEYRGTKLTHLSRLKVLERLTQEQAMATIQVAQAPLPLASVTPLASPEPAGFGMAM